MQRAISFPGAQSQGSLWREVGVTSNSLGSGGRAGGGRRGLAGHAGLHTPGVLEVLLVVVAVEDGEAQHASRNLLSFLLQLCQVLLGIICKRAGK